VLKEVLQPFQIGIDGHYHLGWRVFLHLTPLAGAEPGDLLDNVVLFLPLGVLLALLARVQSAPRVTLTGFVLSLIVETTQLVPGVTVSPGRVADVNDLLGNTIGAAVGYALFRLCGRIAPLARLNTAMTWPPPGRPPRRPCSMSSWSAAPAPDCRDPGCGKANQPATTALPERAVPGDADRNPVRRIPTRSFGRPGGGTTPPERPIYEHFHHVGHATDLHPGG
jgi:hypothetical protein